MRAKSCLGFGFAWGFVVVVDLVTCSCGGSAVERGLKSLRRVEPDAIASGEGIYCVVADRRLAIARAIAGADRDDIVVLAGKGHEDYQIVGHERLPFDDRDEPLRALQAKFAS